MDDIFQTVRESSGGIREFFQSSTKTVAETFESLFVNPIRKYSTLTNIIALGIVLLCAISILFYLNPSYLTKIEGFSTIAVDPVYHPKCFARDAEAQRLLADVVNTFPKSSEGVQMVDEFRLILTKLLCIDADITGSGSGVYSTMDLQFSTFHDMEPVASFVGRCLNRSLKERDIVLTLKKLEGRGAEIIKGIQGADAGQKKLWVASLHNIATRTSQAIHKVCLTPVASLDRPAGPRDPGFHDDQTSLSTPAPYKELGGLFHL
jgi:hypothetical protein